MFSPFGNHTQPATWHDQPNLRGTYSLYSSCIITVGLCAWSAVHLNLPEHGKEWQHNWRKAGWLFLALLAPEVLAYVAVRQYVAACQISAFMTEHMGSTPSSRKLRGFWNKLWLTQIPQQDNDVPTQLRTLEHYELHEPKRHQWTLTHSFYALMGGFVLNISSSPVNFLPTRADGTHRDRIVLTPSALQTLVVWNPELVPNISQKYINDKSKANNLTKLVVGLQIFWFCAQTLTRLIQGLPISLLELNTVAHIACALIIYGFCWYKPLDAREPTTVESHEAYPLCAAMIKRSDLDTALGFLPPHRGDKTNSYQCHLCWGSNIEGADVYLLDYPSEDLSDFPTDNPTPEVIRLDDGRLDLPRGIAKRRILRVNNDQQLYGYYFNNVDGYTDLSGGEVYRLCLASKIELLSPATQRDSVLERYPMLANSIVDRIPNNPFSSAIFMCGKDSPGTCKSWAGLTISGFVYGGLHLLAWNAPFASFAEQLLWRVSSCVITCLGFGPFPALLLLMLMDGITWTVRPRWAAMALKFFVYVIASPLALLVIAYFPAHVYLVVESLISVVHLPPAAFQTPVWTRYIPHIS